MFLGGNNGGAAARPPRFRDSRGPPAAFAAFAFAAFTARCGTLLLRSLSSLSLSCIFTHISLSVSLSRRPASDTRSKIHHMVFIYFSYSQ
jgi:hypothetical protein